SSGSQNAGVITAGEWNDLRNWSFWNDLMARQELSDYQTRWGMFPNQRYSFEVKNSAGEPVTDATIILKNGSTELWKARTDNKGHAELWLDLFATNSPQQPTMALIKRDGLETTHANPQSVDGSVNQVVLDASGKPDALDIAFIVDATGSMGDEINFLKSDLADVIQRVRGANSSSGLNIRTGAVFYRDKNDAYLTRTSDLSSTDQTTLSFIGGQSAHGGGDTPEAVHSALKETVEQLSWSSSARARIAFLLLDAPPHEENQVIQSYHESVKMAAQKGIKLIPITASGIDKSTEFLMRFSAIATNGTYVFITNHSGVGNNHIEATVGQYEVEFLNDLMVRLLNEYVE
ncbi:MAG: vWA domain-containing protein, partial [Owenweeksia sp.]